MPHKPRQVRWGGVHALVVTEWPPACLKKLLPRAHHTGNYRKPQMEDVHKLISVCPTNPIQILNQHEFFLKILCVSFKWYFSQKWKKKSGCWYWSSTDMTGNLLGIKQTYVIPKWPEVVPHSEQTGPQQTVCKFHLGPQYIIFHWGSNVLRVSTLCWITLSTMLPMAFVLPN